MFFDRLKVKVISRTLLSEQKKLSQFLNKLAMEKEKPSQFLRHLQLLADYREDDSYHIFMQRLPFEYQPVLATLGDGNPIEKVSWDNE